MFYDGWTWGAMAAVALLTVDTGGGGFVEGSARTGRDFTGRDRRDEDNRFTFNQNNFPDYRWPDDRGPETDKEKIEWLYIAIYGSRRLGVLGLQNQVQKLQNELILMRIAGAAVVMLLLFLLATLAIIIRSASA